MTVKRLHKKNGRVALIPENKKYKPIEIEEGKELNIWGVVTSVIHKV